jgi:hypothetical protein
VSTSFEKNVYWLATGVFARNFVAKLARKESMKSPRNTKSTDNAVSEVTTKFAAELDQIICGVYHQVVVFVSQVKLKFYF